MTGRPAPTGPALLLAVLLRALICALALGVGVVSAHAGPTERPDEELKGLLRAAVASAQSFEDRFDAEVWLLDMSTRLEAILEDPALRLKILKNVHREAKRAELEPELVLSVIMVESLFDHFAISEAGARGLMQIMPFWLEEIGRPSDDLFHISTNLRYGCTILRHYLNREKGNMTKALARYNGSVGKTWYPDRVYRALRRRWAP